MTLPARVAYVTADLRGDSSFADRKHVIAAALDKAPRGAVVRVRLDGRSRPPSPGWLLALLPTDYNYEFSGTASTCAAWYEQYRHEHATRQQWRTENLDGQQRGGAA